MKKTPPYAYTTKSVVRKIKITIYMANPRWQEDLNSWINDQLQKPRKPFQRDEAIDEILEAFDPLRRGLGAAGFAIPARIIELYDRGAEGMEGRGRGLRRTLQWRFTQGVSKPLIPQMLNKIKREVRRRHKINYRSAYVLLNVESGDSMVYYTNINRPWMARLSQTKEWLEDQEELRLQCAQLERPNTKWTFQRHLFVDLKVILDRQPLQIGLGRLSAWLRNKHEVISLDTYSDDLCPFRCIAVHQGAHKRDNTRKTKELAQSFFGKYHKLTAITQQQFELLEKHFQQAIAVYRVTSFGDFILIHHPSYNGKVYHTPMHMGSYENHAFLIKDINKVLNNFTCGECQARFTQSCHLARHASSCKLGQTNTECPGNMILAPESAFEKAFYPEGPFGTEGVCWLEYLSRYTGKHIHIHHHKESSKDTQLMAIIPKPKLSSSFMVATGMVVSSASRVLNKEPKLFGLIKVAEKQHENSRTYKLWLAVRKSDTWVTTW